MSLEHISHPEASSFRAKTRVHARAGELPAGQKMCAHPVPAIQQFVDEAPGRDIDRPINLFQCSLCNATLWLVDGFGKEANDG